MTNIALIVLDTLRKDSFDKHFDWLLGKRFENAYSTAGWTVPVHGTLFTGKYPSETGVHSKNVELSFDRPVLAEKLQSKGYTTRGFSANPNITDTYKFTRGFEEFYYTWKGKIGSRSILDWNNFIVKNSDRGIIRFPLAVAEAINSDADTFESLKLGAKMKASDFGVEVGGEEDDGAQQALSLLQSTSFGDNEFLFMNLMEAHGPYDPPESYKTVGDTPSQSIADTVRGNTDTPRDKIWQSYDDSVNYLSDIYQQIFEELRTEFDYIITLSDHGEMFGRDGIWHHHYGIYPELVHVPLSIYSGNDEVTNSDKPVSLIDIYPTVLSMANDADDESNRDLRSSLIPRDYLVERCGLRVHDKQRLYKHNCSDEQIRQFDQTLFGVVRQDGIYGWEGRDRFMSTKQTDIDSLKELLHQLRDELDITDIETSTDPEVPEDIKNRMEDLGYM
jgi:arylsulfatase A-like enzyme